MDQEEGEQDNEESLYRASGFGLGPESDDRES